MILLIDNYDSFVYNLARYFEQLGQRTQVVRNDRIGPEQVDRMAPAAVVLSPGPCRPQQAGCCLDVTRQLPPTTPLLGICLGHQVIGEAFGGRVVQADTPMHGRTSRIHHDGRGIFEGVPTPFVACRYHSLVVEQASLPSSLEVSARTGDGVIMAFRHRERPVIGVQFHPEAILTEHGYALLAGFLRIAGLNYHPQAAQLEEQRRVCESPDSEAEPWRPAVPLPY